MAIADESPNDNAAVTLRGIDWRSAFPFTLIFRSFRVAIHPSKLMLALLALLLIYGGGRILDGLWRARPQYRAVADELAIFEESRLTDNPSQTFNDRRNQRWTSYGTRFRSMLPADKPNGNLDDVKAR